MFTAVDAADEAVRPQQFGSFLLFGIASLEVFAPTLYPTLSVHVSR